jgi:hypothetical protein
LHSVVYPHAGGNRSTWGVDQQLDVLFWILRVEKKQLTYYSIRGEVIHLVSKENDALTKE